jgi:hypothetical protein
MTNETEQLVIEYKDKLDKAGATFLLVYAYKNPISDQNVCQISSNSSKEGIRAILHAILMPTKETVDLMTKAFFDLAVSTIGITETAIAGAHCAGVFHEAARSLLAQMRPHWTIKGWENGKPAIPPS